MTALPPEHCWRWSCDSWAPSCKQGCIKLTQHCLCAEKEIKDVKAKQEGAQQAYAAAVTAREGARGRLVEAEASLAGVQAEEAHSSAEIEAGQARKSLMNLN